MNETPLTFEDAVQEALDACEALKAAAARLDRAMASVEAVAAIEGAK